ncbi:MAG TPA: molybdopterin-dependent oxidoreductase [Planctomycetota bacterium]|nr:molybdopterin-dependent oxidoreductase [Planctomycetota bacterium]
MAPRIGPEPPAPNLSGGEKFLHALPFGIGIRNKPRHFLNYLRALWETRRNPGYARKVLKRGVCDGCSLGPAGLRDDVADGSHLCSLRLAQLKYQVMEGIGAEHLGDVGPLDGADAAELRALGRIPKPLIRNRGESGLTETTWDDALDLIAEKVKPLDPRRTAWFAGADTLTNEGAFAFRQIATGLGCPNVDSSVRFGYGAAVAGLADVFGVGAPTSSLKDLLGTDLLVLWGADPSATHPLILKYLHLAKEQGTRVAVVAPRREERLVKYWVPSILESSVFGTRIMDDFYAVRKGGDVAFVQGVLKTLAERNGFDQEFLNRSATGQDELARVLRDRSWGELTKGSGASQADMERFAGIYSSARSAVFLFSTGITRQRRALEAVRSIATLAAARGMVGKKRCGVFPLGASGEQGAIDLGLLPAEGGMTAPQMIKAAQEGKLDFLCSMSGSLLDAPVDRRVVSKAMERIGFRVHIGPVLDPSMLLTPQDIVLVLPSMTRHETPGGTTTTSVERRVRYSPAIPGQRMLEAKPEWEIPALIARRIDLANEDRFPWKDAKEVRADIEREVPRYKGIAGLQEEGGWIQWGGERLYEKGFDALPGGKCRLKADDLPPLGPE